MGTVQRCCTSVTLKSKALMILLNMREIYGRGVGQFLLILHLFPSLAVVAEVLRDCVTRRYASVIWDVSLPSPPSSVQVNSTSCTVLVANICAGLCMAMKCPEQKSECWVFVCFDLEVKIFQDSSECVCLNMERDGCKMLYIWWCDRTWGIF